tara:strand:- start:3903 stop:4526 length:624 start_codon:yes stop_codon:yes gene_type:complete
MKKFIMAVVAFAILLVGNTAAFAGPELSVDTFSRHVWRGAAGPSAISIQPALDLVSFDSNIGVTSVGIWGQIPINGDDTEYDITLAQEVGEYGTVNITSYYYDGPFLESDSHDIEVGVDGSFNGVDLFVGRFISGDAVKDDTYIEIGYELDGYNFHVGAGDGAYTAEGDSFQLVNVGVSVATEGGYGASFIYNPDSETPYLVVSKSW